MGWNEITKETLRDLYYGRGMSDREIAEMYGVSRSQVKYKRNKFEISYANQMFLQAKKENSEIFKVLEADSKERLVKHENIDAVSKALTHYIFRNGPVEDMHADGKLSENDMKVLNKYMVNRLAGIFTMIMEDDWVRLELLYEYYRLYGTKWDTAEPDMEEVEALTKLTLSHR